MTLIRGLLEAAMTKGMLLSPSTTEEPTALRRGFAYVCRRCDVYGYLGPDEDHRCWSCERADSIERR
jgi:hypothetical protein